MPAALLIHYVSWGFMLIVSRSYPKSQQKTALWSRTVDCIKTASNYCLTFWAQFTGGADISDARVVVAAGRGVRSAQDLAMIRELADRLGGVVGASRKLVDDGMISKEHQVGYSGVRVKPALYIACGISGAPQHLVGMKESGTIVAINSDPSAPIFRVADVGIVGDLYEAVPALIEKLKKA